MRIASFSQAATPGPAWPASLKKFAFFLHVSLGSSLVASHVLAENVPASIAQALFEEARGLMHESKFREACPKFAESFRLDPALGTLLNLALCHENEGKMATAYLEYTDAAAQAAREKDESRHEISKQRILALEPLLARVKIRVPFVSPPGFWLRLDETELAPAALGVALPVDPGAHTIRYGAPGMQPRAQSISVLKGETTVSLQELSLEPVVKPVTQAPAAMQAPVQPNLTRRLVAGAFIGGGLAALAFGAYSGFEAAAQWDMRNEHCRVTCDKSASLYGQSAHRFAFVSNVSLGAGLLAGGVGVYLFSTQRAHDGVRVSARSGTTLSTISLEGGF